MAFKGYLKTDAHEGYSAVCRENEQISVGCMTHAQGNFDEALEAQNSVDPNKQKNTVAAHVLKMEIDLWRIKNVNNRHHGPTI